MEPTLRPPRALLALIAGCALVTVAFVATGPWTIGAVTIRRLENVSAIWVLAAGAMLIHRRSRDWARDVLGRDITFSRRTLAVACLLIFLFLLRAVETKFDALEVNAWDFSVSFDRPLEQTARGGLLWSSDLRKSMFAVHCNWLILAFVPLYALKASPWWLLVAQAGAITAAVAALFQFTRAACRDDVLAGFVALAFLTNRHTAHATQFVFVVDIFYPVALFLLFYAFLRRKTPLFVAALFLTLSIKEDAILPLAGFALVAAIGYRRWICAALTMLAAGSVFAFDYFVVLPGFAQTAAPWYAQSWGTYGDTPMSAVGGMLAAPGVVLKRVVTGAFNVFLSLAFVPFGGWPWILAALPTLVIFGSADAQKVHFFVLHYSLPLLPALFASVSSAAVRIGGWFAAPRVAQRITGAIVLAVSALMGSTYELDAPREDRRFIRPLVTAAESDPLYVQGALFPHAGYAANVRVLHHDVVPAAQSAFLLCATCNPYPFPREAISDRIEQLRHDVRYEEIRRGGLSLFRRRRVP